MSSTIPHRYVTPIYPGAAGFDYFNVVSGGVGGGGSAYMDTAKIGGPNATTYAVAFGEDATSSNANRGLRALSQNCDYLDDILHRLIAVTIRTGDVMAGGSVSSITLPTRTFLGVVGTPSTAAGYNLLFEITDSNDNEIIDPSTGAKVQVTAVTLGTGDQIGGGGANGNFSGNTVGLTLSPVIPTGTTYRVYYGTRTTPAELPIDALTNVKIRGAQEVEAGVENLFRLLHGGGGSWNSSWVSTISDLARSGINERYNHATTATGSGPEDYYPTGVNSAGSGAWFQRTGAAVTGYTSDARYADPVNAVFATKFFDSSPVTSGGSTGFVAYGARTSGTGWTGETSYTPGAASFMALWPHHFQSTLHATNPYTRILESATAQFTSVGAYDLNTGEAIVQVTQAGNYFRQAGAGYSAISLGYDMLECTYTIGGTTFRRMLVIVSMGASTDATNITKVRVRHLDGTVPDFSASPTGTIRFVSLSYVVGDGAGAQHATQYGYATTQAVLFDGLFYQVPPLLSAGFMDDNVVRSPAAFSAADTTAAQHALVWGGFQRQQPSGPVFPSALLGDGGLYLGSGSSINNANFTANSGSLLAIGGNIVASGTTSTTGGLQGNYVILTSLSPSVGVTTIGPLTTGGPYVLTFDPATGGSYRYCTASANTQTYTMKVNLLNVRKGGLLYFTFDHNSITSGVITLDWTNGGTATVTSRFGPGDDQVAPGAGRTLWTGIAVSATEVWWTITRL